MNQRKRHRRFTRRAAFTMIECLLGLAISALLLTAVAVAFNASLVNYRENERMYETANSARQALTRITTQLRTADAVNPASPANECSFITAEGWDITYEFRAADNALYLRLDDGTEYEDFDPEKGKWNTATFENRLASISEVVRRGWLGDETVTRVGFTRGRFGGWRRIFRVGQGARLTFARNNPRVQAMVKAFDKDPRTLYASLMLLVDGRAPFRRDRGDPAAWLMGWTAGRGEQPWQQGHGGDGWT